MKFTLSWLKEYLKTDKDINTILETLTNIGLEVEEAFDQYSVYKDFKVAKIVSTKKQEFPFCSIHPSTLLVNVLWKPLKMQSEH